MAVKQFMVEEYQVRLGNALNATFGSITIRARGIVTCFGRDHRFIAYFLTDESPVPNPLYMEAKKVGATFCLLARWDRSLICCATRSRSTPTSTATRRRVTA